MFQLNTYSSQFEILNAIDRIPFLDQTTNTPAAIRYMRNVMFTPRNGDRPFAPNSVIIITDGVPRVPTDVNEARRLTLQEANLARSQGINIFTIGIGPELTRDFLVQIANQPSNQYVFQVNQVRQLETILNQVSSAACSLIPSPTPPGEYFGPNFQSPLLFLTKVSFQDSSAICLQPALIVPVIMLFPRFLGFTGCFHDDTALYHAIELRRKCNILVCSPS